MFHFLNSVRFPAVGIAVCILLLGLSQPSCFGQRGGKREPPGVVVANVVKSTKSATQSFVGTVTPIRTATIGSAVDGRVESVFVEEGNLVSADDPDERPALVQLRTDTLQIEIDAANIELATRQQALAELEITIPNEIKRSEALVEEFKARSELAQSDFDRIKQLHETGGGISRKDFETAQSNLRTAENALLATQTELKKLIATEESRIAQAKFRVDAQQAEVRRLEDQKSKHTIRAPFDGYVVSKLTEMGHWVSKGEEVIEMIQLDPIEIKVSVPQAVIQDIQSELTGDESSVDPGVTVIVESVPQVLNGVIHRIVPQADLRSRTFPVLVRLENPLGEKGHLLKAGMLARVSLAVGQSQPQLFVLKDALVLSETDARVFVAADSPDGKGTFARSVAVQTGATVGDWIQVTGNLAEGDQVVVEGNERLLPTGQAIRILKTLDDSLNETVSIEQGMRDK